VGELVSVPSFPIPTRSEYRIATGFPKAAQQRLKEFRPTLFHIAVPDVVGYRALKIADAWGVPVVASYHTRYDTYLRFYGLGLFEKLGQKYLRHFYNRVRRVYPPSESMAEIIRAQGQSQNVEIWARGVDSELFSPAKRDMAWRRSLGIADEETVVSFAGRLVKEKNTGIVVRVLDALKQKGIKARPMIIGDGPEMSVMKTGLPEGVFVGFLHGEELARAYASSDIFFFPSESETFGNVTLEAMASGLPCGERHLKRQQLAGGGRRDGLSRQRARRGRTCCANRDTREDEALRKRMGDAARIRALGFSWETILSGLVESYRQVLREAAGSTMKADPLVWILWRRRKGDLDQMLALVQALGWRHEIKRLSFMGPMFPALANLLLKRDSDQLPAPWPDVVLCAEALPSIVARKLRAQSQRRDQGRVHRKACRVSPGPSISSSPPRNTGSRLQAQCRRTVDAALRPTRAEAETRLWLQRQAAAHRRACRRIELSRCFDGAAATQFARDIRQHAEQSGGTLAVATSPRTGREAATALKAEITPPHRLHLFGEGENRTMRPCSRRPDHRDERQRVDGGRCARTGKPVSVYPLPQKLNLQWRLTEWLYAAAVLKRSPCWRL
jgi:phosphatidylinositol alpha 1,6-mannosyltransferase